MTASTVARHEETVWATFPKEFERSLADILDKRFTIILALTVLVDCLSIVYFVSTASTQMSEKGADHFRKIAAGLDRDEAELEREAKFVDMPLMQELPPKAEASSSTSRRASGAAGRRTSGTNAAPGGARTNGGGEITGNSGEVSTGVDAAANRRSREDISNAASRAGILGLLASNSGEAKGRAAEDLLGGKNVPAANLDEALANAGGLRRGSTGDLNKPMGPGGDVAGNGSSREVRGSRSTNTGGIDAMVQGLDKGKSQDVQRSGGLEVGLGEPLIEEPSEEGKATGSRDRDAVAAVVAKHTSAIQYCYQRELKRNPNLRGKVVVRFVITPQGTIASVTVLSSNLGNPAVESCIAERIKRWDDFGAIDPSKGNTTFRQVYTFGY